MNGLPGTVARTRPRENKNSPVTRPSHWMAIFPDVRLSWLATQVFCKCMVGPGSCFADDGDAVRRSISKGGKKGKSAKTKAEDASGPLAHGPLRPDISWITFSPNLVTWKGAGGDTMFRRTAFEGYDAALGHSAIRKSGRWEWVVWVLQPEDSFVGVATFNCSKNSDVAPHKVWDVAASDFKLNGQNPCCVTHWKEDAKGCGDKCKIRVLLDMDERTLSFSRNDEPMALAYTGLPAKVHPYLMSGTAGEAFYVPRRESVV